MLRARMFRRAPVLRSAFVYAALTLGGCSRGCSFEPATPCDEDRDCEAPNTCYRGYCSGPGYIKVDRECRAAPGCRAEGRCGALTVRSFLGADSSLECAAVDAADCRAAEVCPASGRCGIADGFCVAEKDEDCAASQRCRSHDECSVEGYECVRRVPECPPLPLAAGAPAWAAASPVQVEVDMQALGPAWRSGAVSAGMLACAFRLPRAGDSRVRIAGRCAEGPYVNDDSETFLLSGVALTPGDEVAVAMQSDWAVGHPSRDSFVKAKYAGNSPFQGGAGEETLVCHVVDPYAARRLGLGALVPADEELASVHAREMRGFSPAPLEGTRRAIAGAARWLGWAHPEIVARLQRMAAVEQAWGEQLGVLMVERRRRATPPRGLLTSEGAMALQVRGHVCGAELAARRELARPTDADACGLELTLTNLRAEPIDLSPSLFYFSGLSWLHFAGGVGELVEVELIDIRMDTVGAARERSANIPAGGRVVLLLGGKQKDLPLARDVPAEFTMLDGRIFFGGDFTLRTGLTADPAGAEQPKGRKGVKDR